MRLDNEVSEEYLNKIEEKGFSAQLVLPCNYRKNISKRDIYRHTNLLMSGISGAYSSLLMIIWGKFIPQEKNHIQPSSELENKPKAIITCPNTWPIRL